MSSLEKAGPGRPKKAHRVRSFVTRRVRRLVDLAHDGNIQQASTESGIPYATLRDLYSGRRTNPSMRTLVALADHYHIPHGWLSDEKQPEEVPMSGYVGYIEPRKEQRKATAQGRFYRQVTFPFAAWEFLRVFRALGDYLEKIPPSAQRPILGTETDDRETNRLLSCFLLQPLLAAEAAGEPDAIVPLIAYVPDKLPTREDEEEWVRKLRILGRMWEKIIPALLMHARKTG